MGLSKWVPVGTSSLASLGQISKLMDVEPMLPWGEPSDFRIDLDLLALNLRELDESLDSRVSIWVHNANSMKCVAVHSIFN